MIHLKVGTAWVAPLPGLVLGVSDMTHIIREKVTGASLGHEKDSTIGESARCSLGKLPS